MPTTSISDQLKILLELQGLDAQLYQLRRQLEFIPREAASLKAQSQKASLSIRALEDQHKAVEVKRNEKEMELGQKEAQIKKLQAQLFQVKTNKEYSAIQKEIEGLKADKSVLEEEILQRMEEIDRLKIRLHSERAALKNEEANMSASLTRLEEESKKTLVSMEQLQATRKTLIPKVDPPILAQYERILERKEGLALVPARNGACGGCHMVLPPQMINEIQMSPKLITCESCARILYIEPTA